MKQWNIILDAYQLLYKATGIVILNYSSVKDYAGMIIGTRNTNSKAIIGISIRNWQNFNQDWLDYYNVTVLSGLCLAQLPKEYEHYKLCPKDYGFVN